MSEARVIGNRYQITALLDRGGMGDVYQGVDQTTGQAVAIKALKPQIVQEDPTLVERFRREANALAKLNHPNIVRVIDTITDGDLHYIVMEFVGGGSLDKLLKQTPQLPVERALQLALDLSDALTRTHRLNIIHRDLKPANVLLADDGTPKLTDFGVARIGDAPGTMLTQIGSILGTVAYLSPEVCEGALYTEKSDIWSFGVMLYQMLTGHLPFEEGSAIATIAAIMGDDVPDARDYRADLPVELVLLLDRMLAKNPEDRISSVRAVGAEIEAILRREPPPTNVSISKPVMPERDTVIAPTPVRTTPLSTPPVSLPPRPSAQQRQKTNKEPIVFLCYRREDTGEIAGRMHEYLIKTFGESSILRDVDRISDRTVSRLVLANDVVSHSDVMVVVIGRNWAGSGTTPAGKPKGIANPKDAIRIQIEAALKQPGMLIVPVLVDGAALPADLPPSLQPLAAAEPLTITEAALESQMKKLVGRIRGQFGGGARLPTRQLIAIAIFLILLLVAFLLVQNSGVMNPPTTPTTAPTIEPVGANEFMVLVAELEPVNTPPRDVTRFIVDDLTQKLEVEAAYSPLRARQYPTVLKSAAEAQDAAARTGAVIVLYGLYTADSIEINLVLGDLSRFTYSKFSRAELEKLANARLELTDPRRESLALYVFGAMGILMTADGSGYEVLRMVTLIADLETTSATVTGNSAASHLFRAYETYVNDSAAALARLNEAIQLEPTAAILYITRASANIRLARWDEARQDVLTADRLSSNADWSMPHYMNANITLINGDAASALQSYDRIVENRPDWFAYNYRGALRYYVGDYAGAEADLLQAISMSPTVGFPYQFSTVLALREGRFDDARDFINTLVTEFPDPSYTRRTVEAMFGSSSGVIWGSTFSAWTNLLLGQYSAVIVDANQALAINDRLADVYMMKGFAQCNLNQLAEAEATYTQGLMLEPDHALLHLMRADVRLRQGNALQALRDLVDVRSSPYADAFATLITGDEPVTCQSFFDHIREGA